MRSLIRLLSLAVIVLAAWAAPASPIFAANLDNIADHVIGQPDFISNPSNNGGVSAHSLYTPCGATLNAQGNLFVADANNNRVLEYNTPLSSGAANRVFGQPDFSSRTSNNAGLSAKSLAHPSDVALDAQGNLLLADSGNNRVLEYDTPLTSDTTADRVFGQPDFNSNTPNNGGVNPNGFTRCPSGGCQWQSVHG